MGVPKFYRWLSERYPQMNQIISDSALLPEFDHLYLDMNGIIHGCTHPHHLDISEVLSERDMMLGILNYLDRIITQIVKPKVSVFLAIDGVAPRAKLNQQRSRRFRSAKELAEARAELQDSSSANVFDSNCITPGTEFMERVSHYIHYFIRKKLKEDCHWKHLQVVFSGHEIPGEGEHKIMQHIREMRDQPNYAPNARHCMYGQDADLIMLGLLSHEPHFTLLREVVDFSFNRNSTNALKTVKKFTKESDFQLLHLSVLREYLSLEFQATPDTLEPILDDFVFMTFLVGNDFLPHMPTLDIGDGAFDLLFDIYRKQRLTWGEGQYLTHAGEFMSPERLEDFLKAVGMAETEILVQREENEATYLKKKRRWDKRDGKDSGPSDDELAEIEAGKQADYETMLAALDRGGADEFVDGWKPVKKGDKDFKGRYYYEKLKLTPKDVEAHLALRKSYIEGLIWCLAYYYKGCISWGWFYPYHYGPMLSDLTDLKRVFAEVKLELGQPLLPFEQLMGCLPPASAALVPVPYRTLMTSKDSPIVEFYPLDFQVDMNGKRNPWEGVNLLPFIDVKLLKDTIAKYVPDSKLSAAERKRNAIGKVYCYTYDMTCTDTIPSPNRAIGLPNIDKCWSRVTILEPPDHSDAVFKPELVPGTQIPFPGFPSLNVIPIASNELLGLGVNCFGTASKYPTMLLKLHEMPQLPSVTVLAEKVIGKSLFINWPMMHEARVTAISNETCEIRRVKGKLKVKQFSKVESERWLAASQTMMETYLAGNGQPGSGGVQIGEVKIRLKLVPLQGMKKNPANGSTKKMFGQQEAEVPLQLALWNAPAPDPRFLEKGPETLKDRFPADSEVVLTQGKYRGCRGRIVGVVDKKKVGVKVQIVPPELPFGLAIARSVHESYISSVDAARILKLHPGIFGKITGSLLFEPGRYDLGLNLKYADGLCVTGYTRKKEEKKGNTKKGGKDKPKAWAAGDSLFVVGSDAVKSAEDDENAEKEKISWEYTPKAIRLVNAYRQEFPQLFMALLRAPNERKYDANEAFGPNGSDWLPVIRKWLDKCESAKLPRTPITTQSMPLDAIAAVQKAADVRSLAIKKRSPKESLIKIPPNALYREGATDHTDVLLASDYNSNHAPELGDRVVNLCASGVPFGSRGTVVAIHEASSGCVEVVMDEEFMGGTSLQGSCSNFRGKLCVWAHLLKISPANSEGLVNKMVPKGSGKAAVDKILSSIEVQTSTHDMGAQGTHVKSSWDTQPESVKQTKKKTEKKASSKEKESDKQGTEPQGVRTQKGPKSKTAPKADAAKVSSTDAQAQPVAKAAAQAQKSAAPSSVPQGKSTPKAPGSTTPLRPSSRSRSPGRAGSTGRGKQGIWREARGPDEKGKGFQKGSRSARESGIKQWKALIASAEKQGTVSQNGPADKPVENAVAGEKAAELKAILGLSTAPAPAPNQQLSNEGSTSAADGLKALLGVGTTSQPAIPSAAQPNQPPPMAAPPPSNAADKLLQLLASKHQQQRPPQPPQHPQGPTPFNFSYVEEGKEPPAPENMIRQHQPSYPVMGNPGGPMGMPMPPHPMFPVPVPPQGAFMPPSPHGPVAIPPHPITVGGAPPRPPQSLPVEDFPPLGTTAAVEPGKLAQTKTEKTTPTSEPDSSTKNHFMIPSVVAAQTRP